MFLYELPSQIRTMVLNGGFEGPEVVPGWPEGWGDQTIGWNAPGHIGTAPTLSGIDRSTIYQGRASYRVVGPGWLVQCLSYMPLVKDKNYVFSAYMKADRPDMEVSAILGDFHEDLTAVIKGVSTEWKRHVVTVRAPHTPSKPFLAIYIAYQQGTRWVEPSKRGTLWVDNVQFEEGSEPTQFHDWQPFGEPGGMPRQPAAPEAQRPATSADSPRPVPETMPPSKAEEGTSRPAGQSEWIDLLERADPQAGRVAGQWKREGQEIVTASGGQLARMLLPATVRANYDMEVEFTRPQGQHVVGVLLPVGSRSCWLTLGAGAGKVHGIDMVDGLEVNDNPIWPRPGTLTNGQRYRVFVQVRVAGESATIDVRLNDQPLLRWAGKQASLGLKQTWAVPKTGQPGLAAGEVGVRFHRARLRRIDASAKE